MHVHIRYVVIVVEAFDILLVTCYSHLESLNLFVESFLRMVQKLLECNKPDMQCLAVESVSQNEISLYNQMCCLFDLLASVHGVVVLQISFQLMVTLLVQFDMILCGMFNMH